MATSITLRDYEEAEREFMQAEERKGFRLHVIAYALVNVLLFGINMALVFWTDADFIWFAFPLAGWTVGLAAHYVFGVRQMETHVAEWQQRIEAVMGSLGILWRVR